MLAARLGIRGRSSSIALERKREEKQHDAVRSQRRRVKATGVAVTRSSCHLIRCRVCISLLLFSARLGVER